jgi:anti-sigma factor RsiW
MTRQELEERLLDYLYDEMEPSQRTAFERSLPAHPEVMREVEAQGATRRASQA